MIDTLVNLTKHKKFGPCLMAAGILTIALGVTIASPESTVNAVADVTPSADTPVFSDTSQSDAEAEGRDVPPCDPGLHVGTDGLCWSGPVYVASDGTTTVNDVHDDGTVTGTVTTPDGESFTFPTPDETPTPVNDGSRGPVLGDPGYDPNGPILYEDDPRWDCRKMGNLMCGVEIMGDWYLVTFDTDGNPASVTPRGW